MDAAKHTPGSWYAASWHEAPAAGATTVVVDDAATVTGKRTIAECREEADARLIAAAPDMLNVLRLARECIWMDRVALADCHTGPEGLDEDGLAGVGDYDAVLFAIDAAIAKATGSAA